MQMHPEYCRLYTLHVKNLRQMVQNQTIDVTDMYGVSKILYRKTTIWAAVSFEFF
jgi:hypothetical protein